MARTLGLVASAVVVGLLGADLSIAQPTLLEPSASANASASSAIQGVVVDESGAPLPGAVISAIGAATAFAVSDRTGRFSLHSLPPGAYVIRAHLQGFAPGRARTIQVPGTSRDHLRFKLTRTDGEADTPAVLAAGVGGAATIASAPVVASGDGDETEHDHSETAWRLRHLPRSVLRDATNTAQVESDGDSSMDGAVSALRRALGGPARVATSLFAPVSGQFNLLTTTSFNEAQDLFSGSSSRGVAYLSLGAAAGEYGDWSMRAALTQGDIASWIVAGAYVTRAPATHQYEFGMSHGLQRYQGGNAAALLAVADGARNVGSLFGRDRWTIRPGIVVGYGAAYARYDYLGQGGLFSPRLDVTLVPARALRVRALASRRMLAPGAEEFLPPPGGSIWLPPQRTFAPVTPGGFRPERTTHVELAIERDLDAGTILGVRAFRQNVTDQIVTLFGSELPGAPNASIGHYWVASGGGLDARGWSVSLSRTLAGAIRGSVDYTFASAQWIGSGEPMLAVLAPSAVRSRNERLHDVTTTLEATVPYVATRVYVLCRVNNAFAGRSDEAVQARTDRRFDVQLNQALPFLNFTSAEWEMLVGVRNMFRDELTESSLYDELLVIRPPKRIVGGLMVRF